MAGSKPERARPLRSVLRRRDYRLLLSSFAISRTGDLLYVVALVVYGYQQTQSAAWVSAATLCRFVPSVVLSPIAGVIADRYERRTMMIVSDVAQLAAMSALTLAAAAGAPALVVVTLALLSATAATAFRAAASSMVQNIAPEDELAAANSLISTVDTLTFVAGPAAGAALLLLGAPTVAFGLNAATFAGSALILSVMHTRAVPAPRQGRGDTRGELRAGLAVLGADRTIATLTGCFVASTVVYGVELVVLVQVSTDRIGTGPGGLGWLVAASGAGGLLGAAFGSRLAAATRPRDDRSPRAAHRAADGLVGAHRCPAARLPRHRRRRRGDHRARRDRASTQRGAGPDGPRDRLGAVAGLRRRRTGHGRGADPTRVERLAAAAIEETATAGTTVIRQSDPADDLFVLVQGTVAVDRDTGEATTRINEMTAPDYLGEIGLLHHTPRTATVTATTDSVLWRIPGSLFLDAVTQGAALSPVLAAGIASRWARTPPHQRMRCPVRKPAHGVSRTRQTPRRDPEKLYQHHQAPPRGESDDRPEPPHQRQHQRRRRGRPWLPVGD